MATRRTYKCRCGTIEVTQSIKDEPLRTCTTCNREYKQTFYVPTFVNLMGMKEVSRKNAVEILERGF